MSKAVGDVTPTCWFSGIATHGCIWWRGFVPDRDDSFDRRGLRDINSRSGIKRDCWPHESDSFPYGFTRRAHRRWGARSEEHTSELQSLMRISYAVFCMKTKKAHILNITTNTINVMSHSQYQHTHTTSYTT